MFFFCFFQPPIVPRITYEGDTRNFDEYPECYTIIPVSYTHLAVMLVSNRDSSSEYLNY